MVHSTAVDVVVIGAGISGLAVADHLISSGRSVVVLEARERIGGRLLGSPLDLGASWFWPGEHRVAELARRLNVGTFEQYRDGDALIDATTGVHRYPGNPIDAPAHRIVGGTAMLAQALAETLPVGSILRGQPVYEITTDLTVITADQAWRADHVVLALPPALGVSTIGLPDEVPREVIEVARRTPVWMGDAVKVVARFDEPFWRRDGLAGAAMSQRGPLSEIHDLSGPGGEPAALFGFARPAVMHAEVDAGVREQLARLFGPRAATPTEVLVQDWSSDRWTTPRGEGEEDDYALFGHPVFRQRVLEGRLHWSSTETAQSFAGHIEGALEAAERAATGILDPPLAVEH